MFGTKKDRNVIELEITFNITAIEDWLKKDGDIKDVEKQNPEWDYSGDVFKSYIIDVLPNGNSADMYFHREKNLFARSVGGIDFNFSTGHNNLREIIKHAGINALEWRVWRQSLSLSANRKPVLLVPLDEIVELQVNGKLNNRKSLREDELIKVPLVYESATENLVKEYVGVWRNSASDRSIGYKNALASVSAHTLNFEVEY